MKRSALLIFIVTLGLETFAQTTGTISIPQTSRSLRERIDVTYMAETFADAAATNRGDASTYRAEQHIGFSYPLSSTRRIQFRQYFLYNMSDYTRTNEWDLGDHVFQYSDSRLTTLGDLPVNFYARLYLPGSDFSRELGKYELRLWTDVEQVLSRHFSLSYFLTARTYAYATNDDGQSGLRLFPGLYLNYNAHRKLVPFAGFYTEHGWRHTGANINFEGRPQDPATLTVNYDSLYHSVGASFMPGPDLKISLYTETQDNLRDGERISWFDEDTTVYYMDVRVGL